MNVRRIGFSLLSFALAGFASCQEAKEEKPAAPAATAAAGPRVSLETSLGKIVIELNKEKAPLSTANFLKYVDEKFYDGTLFHRVIGTFMIQGGGFELVDGKGTQKKPNPPIKNEAKNGQKNLRGTVAMARTNAPHSATSQFFISVVDNPGLNPGGFSPDGYAVFGKVVEGMEVVDKIKTVSTGQKALMARLPNGQLMEQPMKDVPQDDVVVKTARRVKK